MTEVVKQEKPVYKSKIILMSVALFLIGIEPYVPALQSVLPVEVSSIVAVALPILIVAARIYATNTDVKKPLQ